ncbi:glycosyltransferase, partial [Staphylococcus aureus]|uniref:glycosyltransferase n=1 Tax=Staphylococcus aureus TaxID=1280 RepID=UPI0039BDF373
TTGIADILAENGLGAECVSPYLDSADLANKTLSLMRSDALRELVGKKSSNIVRDELDMNHYVGKLVKLAEDAAVRVQQERTDIKEIIDSKLADPEFLLDHHNRGT